MVRTLSIILVALAFAAGSTSWANGSENGHENGNGHHKDEGQGDPSIENKNQNTASAKAIAGASATAKGGSAEQGQEQEQYQAATVVDNSSYLDQDRYPVMSAAPHQAGYCSNGGASAQWEKFGASLGQHPDPVCRRLAYKASLQAEASTLVQVGKLLERAAGMQVVDPKSKLSSQIDRSLADSVAKAILSKDKRIEEQNDEIERDLRRGPFYWMHKLPILNLVGPSE